MQDFNIEIINFQPVPNSTLVPYFNARLNELAANPRVVEITTAKLVLMHHKPHHLHLPIDYLISTDIPMPGSIVPVYKICQIIVIIKNPDDLNVECTITYYDENSFQHAIDFVISDALNRCVIYF